MFLNSWPAPAAPTRFTAAVQHGIRQIRWQAEERVDQLFNAAMVAAALLVAVGLAGIFNVGLILSVAGALADVLSITGTAMVAMTAPSLATYTAVMGLLASALVMWWWAEGTLGR